MFNLYIKFIFDQIEKFLFNQKEFPNFDSLILKKLPIITNIDSFTIKDSNVQLPIINSGSELLIKNKLNSLMTNKKISNVLDYFYVRRLSNKFYLIFNNDLNSYHSPNIYIGALTIQVDKLEG
ncbi:hypothetical protein [Acinetobacter sp. Marseille-Q1618]|uniref:hypothetical protein n=1 Tax=Acinetobacter sp. Marseille-Q1618 TaxID=2697502 RepID=UPI00156FE8D7|nr:hypothetical protein [Acinetobacter sp. Marseille-Q1618]